MKCPFCGELNSKVLDSRTTDDGSAIRRRRACESCGERFTSFERVDAIQLTVIKSDNTREAFDRAKIFNSILNACAKRKITTEEIEAAVNEIENYFNNSLRKEIPTKEIGELVMEKLKTMDEVAYVRFASVYRQFKDIDTFFKELTQIIKDRK